MRFRSIAVLVLSALWLGLAPTALAAPGTPRTGPFIDGWSGYEGQRKCMPAAKPGVLAFRTIILAAYPGTGAGGIGRACSVGGTSEHKEGRAWDWGVNVGVDSQRRAAEGVIDWITAKDRYGNQHAVARRLGIMYLIWNKRIFFPGGGWRTYCRMRRGVCVDPDDGGARSPHTDHVHFSFTWAGAYKKTTFWHAQRTYLTDVATTAYGSSWALGGNGAVVPVNGAPYLGDKSDDWLDKPAVALASTPDGRGYWMSTARGRVYAFGEARRRGSVENETVVADMTAHPSGRGYWIVSRGGRVYAFGKIPHLGSATDEGAAIVGIEPSVTGKGYWLLTEDGKVIPFGDAPALGGLEDGPAVGMIRSATGLGYWIATATGKVRAFGDAAIVSALNGAPNAPVVAIAPSPNRLGYLLVTAEGDSYPFGDASPLRLAYGSSLYATSAALLDLRALVPADL